MSNNNLDGVFNIPPTDSTHVWELNFEHNYLEIHVADNFQMPDQSFLLPMNVVDGGDIWIHLPMLIKSSDGNTTMMNRTYWIDTGMPWDIVLKETDNMDFLDKRTDAVWTGYLDGYFRQYSVEAILFDDFLVDSLRLYRFEYRPTANMVGQNFLKRFNVFFDMKNKQMGLQPISNYQRIVNPLFRRFNLLLDQTPDGKTMVKMVADSKSNYYKTAGIMEGDELVAVEGISFKDLTNEQRMELYEQQDTLLFDIIRNNQSIQILVHIDRSIEQGD